MRCARCCPGLVDRGWRGLLGDSRRTADRVVETFVVDRRLSDRIRPPSPSNRNRALLDGSILRGSRRPSSPVHGDRAVLDQMRAAVDTIIGLGFPGIRLTSPTHHDRALLDQRRSAIEVIIRFEAVVGFHDFGIRPTTPPHDHSAILDRTLVIVIRLGLRGIAACPPTHHDRTILDLDIDLVDLCT